MFEPLSKIPSGMRYYFGAEARVRRAVEDACMSVFDGWSYEEIATPSVDYYALFEHGMGHDEAHRAFRFTDTDGRMLALRPDVTSSVARAAATLFAERARPLRLCYAAPVFRQRSRSHAEWRRENRQIGCELIGAGSRDADVEVLAIAAEVLESLGLRSDVRITLNNVGVFNGVAESLRLDAGRREQMRRIIDVRDVSELRRFLTSTASAVSPDGESRWRLPRLSGKREVLDEARRVISNEQSRAALTALEHLWGVVENLGLADLIEIDLGDVSGLDYYTGLVFKIYVAGAGARVGSGGRYDDLIANFGRREPAVGFVLELDTLTEVVLRKGFTPAGHTEATSSIESTTPVVLFADAKQRRANGQRVRISLRDEG
ncbi:MAG TPA: ATP phosphoribosyltransferase regulatory subunit [Pyrinomonadaceae bacterium]|nr:ATP phosphoribosyltransferase regulatory subunit [Pyrinomonadaceae bacterium]